MKAFPNPLTPAEEKKYIQRYTEGDLEAKHILIERNLRLVAHVIRKYQNTSEDPEDLISIGTIGLIKAVITFDPEKGNRLAAYASRCVENEVLMYLRARKNAAMKSLFMNRLAQIGKEMKSTSTISSNLQKQIFQSGFI